MGATTIWECWDSYVKDRHEAGRGPFKIVLGVSCIRQAFVSATQIIENMVLLNAGQFSFTQVMGIYLGALKTRDRVGVIILSNELFGFFNQTEYILAGYFALAAFPRMEIMIH